MRAVIVKEGKVIGGALKDGIYLVEIDDSKISLLPVEISPESELGINLSLEDIDYMIRRGAVT